MDHFIRLIFDEDQGKQFMRTFAGAMAHTLDENLMESDNQVTFDHYTTCLLYTSPSPRDLSTSRMPSSA